MLKNQTILKPSINFSNPDFLEFTYFDGTKVTVDKEETLNSTKINIQIWYNLSSAFSKKQKEDIYLKLNEKRKNLSNLYDYKEYPEKKMIQYSIIKPKKSFEISNVEYQKSHIKPNSEIQ